ncbi:glycosyltransferase family 4 protein [Niveibacterium sp. SC-1]|uniref:glycosyltransferase family 4 protein n=1 Tax=Niveibacterium sp. SC-1 TaxID=3135646 RepID=UPI0031204E4F
MKLALVRQRYTAFGGAERFVERAIAALAREDLQLTLLTRKWSGDAEASAPRPALRILDPFYLGRAWRDWSFARAVQAEVARGDYDLVQSHERVPGCDIYRAGDGTHLGWLQHRARLRGQHFRTPLAPYHRYVLDAERAMFAHPRLRAVICNSRFIQREIASHFGLPLERLPLIENGVDLARFRPADAEAKHAARVALKLPLEARLFGFVGSGFERKGLDACIRHLPAEVHLVVAGKDREEPRYRRLAAQAGCARRVHFLGPQRDVAPIYRAADAFVFPAVYEPFGNVVLEAMASGLPALTSRSCGAESLIREGENGWLVDAFDADQIRSRMQALADLLETPAQCATVGAAARKAAESLTPETMSTALVALYRRLLA